MSAAEAGRGGVAAYLAVAKAAREFLTPPEAWTKGALGRVNGQKLPSNRLDEANSCCLSGAILRSGGSAFDIPDRFTIMTLWNMIGDILMDRERSDWITPIPAWNDRDETTHADVLDVLDRLIATLEAEQVPS